MIDLQKDEMGHWLVAGLWFLMTIVFHSERSHMLISQSKHIKNNGGFNKTLDCG